MKKEIIICVCVLALVVVLNIITQNYTDKTLGDMSEGLESVREIVKEEDAKDVDEEVQNVISKWDKYKKLLVIYIEHDELEKVEQYLLEVKSYTETKEYAMAIQSIDTCNFIIDHIKDKYKFSLKNIF